MESISICEGKMKDEINKPPHYTKGKIEVIDFILDQNLDYITGNIIKYIIRAPHKGSMVTDLRKAQWYLNLLLEQACNPKKEGGEK